MCCARRRRRRPGAAFTLLFVAASCGKPPVVATPIEAVAERPDAGEASPEVLDEINSHFNMRRPQVARCYTEAVASASLARKAKGRITVALTITPEGSPTDVKVTESTPRSDVLSDCIVGAIAAWQLPAPGATTPFSFSYDFEPE